MNFRWEFKKNKTKKNVGCSSFTIARIINTAIIWASTRETLSSGVCEQHRRRPACASAQSDQRLFFCFLESIICKLAAGEISIFKLVSLAEETGLKHSLSKHPPPPPPPPPTPENSFSHNEAHMIPNNLVLSEKKYPRKKNASGFSSFLRHGKRHFFIQRN